MLPIVDSVLSIVNKFIPDQDARDKIALEVRKEENKLNAMQADIIKAEQNSDSYLTRNWRPLFALMMVCMIGINYILFVVIPYLNVLFDWNIWTMQDPGMSSELWVTIRICLGGYIGARSVEKVIKVLKR